MSNANVKVYRMWGDVNRYQSLFLQNRSLVESFWEHPLINIDGRSKAELWQPLDLFIPNPRKKFPNFFECELGSFAVEAKAAELCELMLLTSGELLPVRVEDRAEPLQLFNPTHCLSCLNRQASCLGQDERDPAFDGAGERYVFDPGRFDQATIVMTPDTGVKLFAIEETGDPDEEFKAAVERHALLGLEFELVWEEGREPFWVPLA